MTLRALIVLACSASIGIAYELLSPMSGREFGGAFSLSPDGVAVLRQAAIFSAMLFGILSSRIVAEARRETKQRRSVWRLIQTALNDSRTLVALLVSPIVYFAIYAVSRESADTVPALLLAYQNGFCWEAVLARAETVTPSKSSVAALREQ